MVCGLGENYYDFVIKKKSSDIGVYAGLGSKVWSVLICLFCLTGAPWALGAGGANSDKSIDALLHESEKALLNSQAPDEEAQPKKETRPKPKKKVSSQQEEATPREAPSIVNTPIKTENLPPIDTTAIQNVISVDLEASQKEREPVYPIPIISVSGGLHDLSPVYSLMKDDDNFSDAAGGMLGGFYLSFMPTWKIGFLERHGDKPQSLE